MLKKLYHFARPYQWMIIACVLLSFGEVVCDLFLPKLMAEIVDSGIPEGNLNYIVKLGVMMVLIAIAAILFGVYNVKFSSHASQGFAARLRQALYQKNMAFSFENIDKFSPASLITRMTSDVTTLQMTMMMSLRILTRAPLMLISAYAVSLSINANLSMIIAISVLLLVVGTIFIVRAAGRLFSITQKKLDKLNGAVQENLIAIRTVKAFVREMHEKVKFKKSNDELVQASVNAGNLISFMMPMMMLVLNGTTLAVIWVGGNYVGSGTMSTGDLLRFISYIMQILMSVLMFSMIFVMITRAQASGARITEVLDAQISIRDNEAAGYGTNTAGGAGKLVTAGHIEFSQVACRYKMEADEDGGGDTTENIIEDISFTAEPGEVIGIVGGTGSGKTTLVHLIPRFYDCTGGAVRIDGMDVKEYAQQDLRDAIGMVMQKNNLFSGTIRENILWGNENASEEALYQAAKDAQAYDFIMGFPKGFDTELGQGGVNVSGGQKQRICIARALIKNPKILILDDSTSAVDTTTEKKIRMAFENNYPASTIFIVAQRISSVKEADKIIVLDDGKICGIGTHDTLLASNAIYQEICHSQMEGGAA